ncbi:MAG: CheR family methyltransferase [Chromatiales bacterium]|jgi:chemotaxis protein methyltransferase CheR
MAQASVCGETRLRIWSAGCASGEEPYTMTLMFALGDIPMCCESEILATDADPHLLMRARRACYPSASCENYR